MQVSEAVHPWIVDGIHSGRLLSKDHRSTQHIWDLNRIHNSKIIQEVSPIGNNLEEAAVFEAVQKVSIIMAAHPKTKKTRLEC